MVFKSRVSMWPRPLPVDSLEHSRVQGRLGAWHRGGSTGQPQEPVKGESDGEQGRTTSEGLVVLQMAILRSARPIHSHAHVE